MALLYNWASTRAMACEYLLHKHFVQTGEQAFLSCLAQCNFSNCFPFLIVAEIK